jgi:hypothetical protein
MAADSTQIFADKMSVLLTKQNELLKMRLELEEKWLKFANKGANSENGDRINIADGYTSVRTQKHKIEILESEIKQKELELSLMNDPQVVQRAVENYQGKDEAQTRCELGHCLQMLDQFLALGAQISLINAKQIEEEVAELKASDAQRKNQSSGPELAMANLDLERESFECERTLAHLSYDSWVQPQGIAECFYSVTKAYERELGAPNLKTDDGLGFRVRSAMGFVSPQTSVTGFATGLENIVADDILSSPNYSVTPELAFRKAYELSRGNLYLTLRTLYNTLRLHRTDVDFQRKLIDLRGDRPQKGRNGGDWYHFFGTMLAEQIFGYKTAMYGTKVDKPSHDEKKKYNNRAGVQTMARLEALIQGKAKASRSNPCDLKYQLSKYPADEIK